MKTIGLTGGIASGKSTVSAMLEVLGAIIIDADKIARAVVALGTPALDEIVAAFGRQVLNPDGSLKRSALSRIVFNNPEALKKLNDITHYRIIDEIRRRIAGYSDLDRVIILDAALLIELGLSSLVDETWLVCVRPEIQVSRLVERETMSEEDAWKIINVQLPLSEKIRVADCCIDNNGSLKELGDQVSRIWEQRVEK